jgi:hypothetical protein
LTRFDGVNREDSNQLRRAEKRVSDSERPPRYSMRLTACAPDGKNKIAVSQRGMGVGQGRRDKPILTLRTARCNFQWRSIKPVALVSA